MEKNLPELREIDSLFAGLTDPLVRVRTLLRLEKDGESFPLEGISIGSREPDCPVLVLTGGVHGLERIGSHVILAYLRSLLERLSWSRPLREQLGRIRIVAVPVVNPVGMARGTRCNGNGVDLMRNAPVESPRAIPFFGGHRLSPMLPYYRGRVPGELEPELVAIQRFIEEESGESPASVCLDVHSGFGGVDQLWFPYAREYLPIRRLAEAATLIRYFEQAFPNHPYRIEPQARRYCTHGDFWDYLHDLREQSRPDRLFLPLTLEMGSWMWIKKNPTQLFSFLGAFDPVKPHRRRRVLRRHILLLDFLRDSIDSFRSWAELDPARALAARVGAIERWYAGPKGSYPYNI